MLIRTANDVGALVRTARRRQKWTQVQLADRARTSQKWISALENGRSGAPLDQVLRVLTVLGVKLRADLPGKEFDAGDSLVDLALGKGSPHGK